MGLLKKVKEFANETFLKEATCSCCHTKGRVINFKKLKDGKLLCKRCEEQLPLEFALSASELTLEQYDEAMKYKKHSDEVLRPIFRTDLEYEFLKVDSKNRLLHANSALIFELDNIDNWNILYKPEEVKNYVFSDKVTGNVELKFKTKNPKVECSTIIAYGKRAKCWIPFGTNEVIYDMPKDLKQFIVEFNEICPLKGED